MLSNATWRRANFLASVFIAVALCVLLSLVSARADDSIDPSLIPDGTYPAHVDRVVNDQHM